MADQQHGSITRHRDDRIRERANRLWESAGRPGSADDFLEQATLEIDGDYDKGSEDPAVEQPRPLIPG